MLIGNLTCLISALITFLQYLPHTRWRRYLKEGATLAFCNLLIIKMKLTENEANTLSNLQHPFKNASEVARNG